MNAFLYDSYQEYATILHKISAVDISLFLNLLSYLYNPESMKANE